MTSVRRAVSDSDLSKVRILNRKMFGDLISTKRGAWWIAWSGGNAVGFAGARSHRHGREWGCYLTRGAVLPSVRGRGLQARMIRARLRWAASEGMPQAWTYTAPGNAASMRSLMNCGFKPWAPSAFEGAPAGLWVYWKRNI